MSDIFLTNQAESANPNINSLSREILFSVAAFYKRPERAENLRSRNFTEKHRVGYDSGGFQFLMGKLKDPDPMKTVELYKSIGLTAADFPIQLDLPPSWHLSLTERIQLIEQTARFYHIMVREIPSVIPVIHGWTQSELEYALNLIEQEEKAEKLFSIGSYEATRVVAPRAVGTFLSETAPRILDYVVSHRKAVAVGSFYGSTKDWVMGQMNPHKANSKNLVAAGSFYGTAANHQSLSELGARASRSKTFAVGSFYGTTTTHFPLPEGSKKKGKRSKIVATPHHRAEQQFGDATLLRTPANVVIERLGMVLNMFKDRELFMLGGASPNDMHILFMSGAKYADSSSWRIKAMVANLFIPNEATIVSVGRTENAPRPSKHHKTVIRESLKDPTNPLYGMSTEDFLELASLDIPTWRARNGLARWGWQPFAARAIWNAWVLKFREEPIAAEFACDPDKYYHYLKHERFHGHPNLTRKLDKIWNALKYPYTQEDLGVFLKQS